MKVLYNLIALAFKILIDSMEANNPQIGPKRGVTHQTSLCAG